MIVLYSTNCPKCLILKEKLYAKGIKFTENTNVEEMQNLGFNKVPILKVDNEFFDFTDANKYINNY